MSDTKKKVKTEDTDVTASTATQDQGVTSGQDTTNTQTAALSSEELLKKVDELEIRVTDSENKLRTALADYQNMLREVDKQRAFVTDMIKKDVFSDLIELFTDLYMSLEQLPAEMKEDSHIQGVSIIVTKYRDLLKKHNVTELSFKEGDSYDPAKAEVVGIIPDAEKDGVIHSTMQPGYSINDVLIKPARVMIFKKG